MRSTACSRAKSTDRLFETRGFWAELLARGDKLRAKARSRKKKYHRLLREVRESTGPSATAASS